MHFDSVFISYGRADALDLALRLKGDLEARIGCHVWLDQQSIERGAPFDVRIEQGIRAASVVLAVMTSHSVREDSVCRDEVVFALNEGKPVVPLRKDATAKPPLLLARRNWVDFTQEYEGAFDALARYLAGDVSALLPPRLPTVTGFAPLDCGPEIARFTAGFTGRQWLNREVDAWLQDPASRALVIIGEPGVGKSAIAAWLSQVRRDQVVAVHFCTRRNTRTLDPFEFVACLVAQLHAQLDGYAPAVEAKHPEARRPGARAGDAFRELVVEVARALPAPSRTLLLIVDSLDEAARDGETVVDVLVNQADDLPPWLRIVATTRPEDAILRSIRRLSPFELKAERPENRADVAQYIRERLRRPTLVTRVGSQAEQVATRLEPLAQGNFQYAVLALDALETGTFRLEDLGHLTPGLAHYYENAFQRSFPDADVYARHYLPLLKALAVAFGPLPLALLQRISDRPPEDLHRCLRALRTYLRVSGQGEATEYALFHQSLRDWLADPDASGDYHCDVRSAHALLAAALLPSWQGDAYALRYLPAHLREAGMWEELLDILDKPRGASDGVPDYLANWVGNGEWNEGLLCLTGLLRYLGQQGGRPITLASLATQLARIRTLRGEHDEAQTWLKCALEHASGRRGRRVRAVAFHELASLHLYRGDLQSAERDYRRALTLCRWGVPVLHDEASANWVALATISLRRYRWKDAIRFAVRALCHAQRAGDSRHAIAARLLIADARNEMGQYGEARSAMLETIGSCGSAAAGLDRARVLAQMAWFEYGQALLLGSSLSEVTVRFSDAQDAALLVGDRFSEFEAQLGLGWCALASGAPEGAEDAHQRFAAVERGLGRCTHPELGAYASLGLAAVAHATGNLPEAERRYAHTVDRCEIHRLRELTCTALVGLGAILWHTDRTEEALSAWHRAQLLAASISLRCQQVTQANTQACRAACATPPR